MLIERDRVGLCKQSELRTADRWTISDVSVIWGLDKDFLRNTKLSYDLGLVLDLF